MPAGADDIRFQSPNFQVSFWKLSDYVLGNLLFLRKMVQDGSYIKRSNIEHYLYT